MNKSGNCCEMWQQDKQMKYLGGWFLSI